MNRPDSNFLSHSNEISRVEDESSDQDKHEDIDSGYWDSVAPEPYESYHGRRYHGLKNTVLYLCPNDHQEQERLHDQHFAFELLLNGRLHLAPLPKDKFYGKILDVGTGAGDWAECMADACPECEVIGIDISPMQSSWVPPNLTFEIQDARQSWLFSHPFDYIHTRATVHMGCWGDFKKEVIEEAYKNLRPGGWFESQEITCLAQSDDGTLPPDGPLSRWVAELNLASAKVGRPRDVADNIAQWYAEAGFVDVKQQLFKIPLSRWPKTKNLRDLGSIWALNLVASLDGHSVRLFDVAFGRDAAETREMLIDVRKEIMNPMVHAYSIFCVVYGRKPFALQNKEAGEELVAAKQVPFQSPSPTRYDSMQLQQEGTPIESLPLTPVPDLYGQSSSNGSLKDVSDGVESTTDETTGTDSDYLETTWLSQQQHNWINRIMRTLCAYIDSRITMGTTETGRSEKGSNESPTKDSGLGAVNGKNESGCPGKTAPKRSNLDRNGDGDEDGDGDSRRSKRRRGNPSDKGEFADKKFACPYYKRNRKKYSKWTTCPGPGWDEVYRVKGHLYRRHALPLQCPRCWESFTMDGALRCHLQQDPPCTVQSNKTVLEGFTPEQEKKLRSRKKSRPGMSEEDKWRDMYKILFSDDDFTCMPSPYYEDHSGENSDRTAGGGTEDYAIFLRREMPPLVRRELEQMFQTEFHDVEERVRPRIEQMILNLQSRLLNLYEGSATADHRVSEQTHQPQRIKSSQSQSVQDSANTEDQLASPQTIYEGPDNSNQTWVQSLSPTDLAEDLNIGLAESMDFDKLLDPSFLNFEWDCMNSDVLY